METLYDEERKYLVHLGVCLIVEYILFLIILRGLSHCKVIHPNLREGKLLINDINRFCLRGGELFLTFFRVLVFLYLCYLFILKYILKDSIEWNIYINWGHFLGMFYFMIASIFSVRKATTSSRSRPGYRTAVLDPKFTVFTNNLFNMLVPVACVSSAFSGFIHRDILYKDHVVTMACLVEMVLNTFRVGAGDVFLCISFSLFYIGFVWVTSAFLEVSDWPHNIFKMKTKWCVLTYNLFILSHFVCFALYYLMLKYIFVNPDVTGKVFPHDDEGFSTLPSSEVDETKDDNSVSPFKTDSSVKDPNLEIQDIESNRQHKLQDEHESDPQSEPIPEPDPVKNPEPDDKPEPLNSQSSTVNNDAQIAELLAQMIDERTAKKKVQSEAEKLRREVEELKELNNREHVKLVKVVDKLSERDLQLKQLEVWLSAKNDEELSAIKMQMAEKLNDLSIMNRPKSARGGDVLAHTSALQDMDAKDPVQTKNLQALSALRKMKEKKISNVDDTEEQPPDDNFMYRTL